MKSKNKYKFFKKNQKFLLISAILILIVIFIIYFFRKNNEEIISDQNKTVIQTSTLSPTKNQLENHTYTTYYRPFPNSTPLFTISTGSDDQKKVWNFIKSNFEINPTVNDDGSSFEPFIIKPINSEYKLNLSGFDLDTVNIKNGQERVKKVTKVEELIVKLGYTQITTGFKNDIFEMIDDGRKYFIKDNQVFSLRYSNDDCDDQSFGCYIRVTYFNNIKEQIESQLKVIDQFTINNKDSQIVGLLGTNRYFEDIPNAIVYGKYRIFRIGQYNSDVFDFLTEIDNNGKLKVITISELSYDSVIENLPNDVWCALKSLSSISVRGQNETQKCGKYLKLYNPPERK